MGSALGVAWFSDASNLAPAYHYMKVKMSGQWRQTVGE